KSIDLPNKLPVSVAFSPDGSRVVATLGGGERQIKMWKTADWTDIPVAFKDPRDSIGVFVHPEGKTVFVVANFELVEYDLASGAPIKNEKIPPAARTWVPASLASNGNLFACWTVGRGLGLIDVDNKTATEIVSENPSGPGTPLRLRFTSDGKYLVHNLNAID